MQHSFSEDEDYTYSSSSDVLDDNDSSDCDSIPILTDTLDEEEECFTVSLSTTTTFLSGLTISPHIGTVCITDDDRELYFYNWIKHFLTLNKPQTHEYVQSFHKSIKGYNTRW